MNSSMILLLQALKLLSVMTAIRLTERPDNISHLLFSSLIVDPSSQDITVRVPTNHLGLSTWEEVILVAIASVFLWYK